MEGKTVKGKAQLIYRQCKGWHGERVDEVKSDMQKRIRRGDSLAVYNFAEQVNLCRLFPDDTLAKGIRTNAINRLAVTSAEDVGVADLGTVLVVLRTLLPQTWKKKRSPFNYAASVACVELLCQARKTRISSWLYHAYGLARKRQLASELGLAVALGDVPMTDTPLDDLNLFRCFENKSEKLIWERIASSVKADSPYAELMKWLKLAYDHQSEKRPFLSLALATLHFKPPVNLPALPLSSPERIRELEEHEYELSILPDSVDKHTARGRAMGADRLLFVERGAIVHNEALEYRDENLIRIYAHNQ